MRVKVCQAVVIMMLSLLKDSSGGLNAVIVLGVLSLSVYTYQALKSGHFLMPNPARTGPSIAQTRPAQSHYTPARPGPT